MAGPRSQSLLAAVLLCLLVAGLSPIGGASHGADANFTVTPAESYDHRPGIDDASYKSWSTGPDDAPYDGFRYLEHSTLIWEAGTLGGCGPADTEVVGIDRGNDDPGTEVDEEIGPDNIKGRHASEDRVTIEFATPDDPFGEPVHLNASDEFVSWVSDCRGNPDEPGWYQIAGRVNGTTWSGEHVDRTTTSHYFWICDCEDEAEARERLGPPPSEDGDGDGGTNSATSTPTTIATAGTQETATGTARATDAPTDTVATDDPTATAGTPATTAGGRSTETGASTPTATATSARWARGSNGDAPGFGALAALVAVALVALWARAAA